MDYQTSVMVTLIIYKIMLIAVGIWSNKKNNSTADYFIGGRTLGPWVAAVSAAASASSAWSLLGMSGAAYLLGLPAIWIVPSVILGYCFNWLWIAPRIEKAAKIKQSVTLTDFITSDQTQHRKKTILLATFCIVFSFAFYIAAQFQAAGSLFSETFSLHANTSIILGTIIILIYTLLGGFWAVSITDTIQGFFMVITAILLPVAALWQIGGFSELWHLMEQVYQPHQLTWFGEHHGIYALSFLLGTAGIGVGNPGQPHVINRLMALKDENAVKQGKYIGIGWSVIIFVSMLLVGWCAKAILATPVDGEQAMIIIAQDLFHPVLAGVVVAATLSAIMSTADSQLLVAASAVSYDMSSSEQKQSLIRSRITVVAMCLIAMSIAIFAPKDIFSRVLFAWNALGAAFGPILIVILLKRVINPKALFFSMLIGFGTTLIFHWLPAPPGDLLERIVPFLLAFSCCWLGSNKVLNDEARNKQT